MNYKTTLLLYDEMMHITFYTVIIPKPKSKIRKKRAFLNLPLNNVSLKKIR